MSKLYDWPRRYSEFIAEARTTPFKWFDHDCVTFAAKALDAQYDFNLMQVIAQDYAYQDAEGAQLMIARHGGLEQLVTEVLDIEPIPPGYLTTGDAVLYAYGQEGFAHALAVHDGHQLLIPGAEGIVSLHVGRALKGWRP